MLPREIPLMICCSSSLIYLEQDDRHSWRSSGPDGLSQCELSVFNGENDGGFGRVAVIVDCDCAAHAVEIFRGGDCVPQLRPVCRSGAPDRVHEDADGVVAQCRNSVRSLIVLFMELLHEILHDGARV